MKNGNQELEKILLGANRTFSRLHMLLDVKNISYCGMIPGSSMLLIKGPDFHLRLYKITILILIDRRINRQD